MRRGDLQSLHRSEHGDSGRDDAVAIQERGAEETDDDQPSPPPLVVHAALLAQEQCEKRQNSALAAVIRPQNEDDVFDTDDQDQSPQEQREDSINALLGRLQPVRAAEALAEGIQRAGSDVAVNDSQRRQRKKRQSFSGWVLLDMLSLRSGGRLKTRRDGRDGTTGGRRV